MNKFISIIIAAVLGLPIVAKAQSSINNTRLLTRTVSDGQFNRTYRAYVPRDFRRRSEALQLVIGYHSASNSAVGFERDSELHLQPEASNAIIVYPDGDAGGNGSQPWNAGFCCSSADDLAFFGAILADLEALTVIKPKVAITGYSSGAMMVYELLCKRGDQIAMSVPFSAYLRDRDVSRQRNCT
jgi:poly(3-hydroxybutyrate) depolymerase